AGARVNQQHLTKGRFCGIEVPRLKRHLPFRKQCLRIHGLLDAHRRRTGLRLYAVSRRWPHANGPGRNQRETDRQNVFLFVASPVICAHRHSVSVSLRGISRRLCALALRNSLYSTDSAAAPAITRIGLNLSLDTSPQKNMLGAAWLAFVGLILALALPLASHAQDTGYISGTVTDKSGAAVVSAEVVITNTAGSLTRTTTTNSDGAYVVAGLPGSTY